MSKRSFLRKSAVSVAATLGLGALGSVASGQVVLPPNLTVGVETLTPGLYEGRVAGAFNTTDPNPKDRGILLEPIIAQTPGSGNVEPWPDNTTYIYTGQMFFPDNTGTGTSTFALAEHVDDSTQLSIDGNVVLSNTQWDVPNTTGVLNLPSGWHDVEFRFGEGGGGWGPSNSGGWVASPAAGIAAGFGVDFTVPIDGAQPPTQTNFTRPVDPGNATVFRVKTYNVDTSRDNQNFTVNSDAKLTVLQGREVPFGTLTVANGAKFTVDSTTTAKFTEANVGATSTFDITSGTVVAGPLKSTAAVTSITKTGAGRLVVPTGAGSTLTGNPSINVNGGTFGIGVSNSGTSVGTSPINLNGGSLAIANDTLVPNGPGTFNTTGKFYLDDDIFNAILTPGAADSSNGFGWSGLDSKTNLDSKLASRTTAATVPINIELNFPRGDGNLVDGSTNDETDAIFNTGGANVGVSITGAQQWVTTFTGKLNVTSAGPTGFGMASNGGSAMFIDLDQGPGTNWTKVADNNRYEVFAGGGNFQEHGTAGQNADPPNIPQPAMPNLSAGVYDFAIGWMNTPESDDTTPEAGIEAYWVPAGGTRGIIPFAAGGPVTLGNAVNVTGASGIEVQARSATLSNLNMAPGSSLLVSGNQLTTSITATGAGTVSVGSAGQPLQLTTLSDGGNAVTFAANRGQVLLTRAGGPGTGLGATSSVGALTGGTLVATGDAAGNTLGGAPVTLSGGTLELRVNLGTGVTQSHAGDTAFDGTFTEDVLEPGTTPGSNYLVYRGLTASGLTLQTTPLIGGTARAPVNAVELRHGNTSLALKFGMEQPDGAGGDDGNSAVTGPAGVNNTPTWNNFGAGDVFSQPVPQPLNIDVSGAATPSTATVTWNANNHWSSTGRGEENNTAPPGENRDLMAGYLDTGGVGGVGVTVNLTGLPASLTSGTGYDLYVYIQGGVNGRGGDYTVTAHPPAPNFASNVHAIENSTINVSAITGAQLGNLSADAGKTLTVIGNKLKTGDVSAGAGGTVLFNTAQSSEVAGAIGGAGSIAVTRGTLDFTASTATSSGTGTLDIRAPANFGTALTTVRFAPGTGNTHAAAGLTAIKNAGVFQAANGIVDLRSATMTTTPVPTTKPGLIEITLNGGFNTGAVPLPTDFNAATYTLELTSANTRDTDAARVYPTNSTQVYLGEIFIPDTDGDGRAGPIAFGEHFDDGVLVRVAGQTLLNNNQWDFQTDSGEFELPAGSGPGWYPFEARLGRGGGPNGNQAPWDVFGIGMDTTTPFNPAGSIQDTAAGGQADTNEAAYTKPVDNGSMNLFRFTAPQLGQVNVDGGATLKLGAIQGASAVNIAANGRLELHGATSKINASALSIAGTPTAPTSTLDVTTSAIALDYPTAGPSPANDIRSRIIAGRGNTDLIGNWSGKGITSSSAQADPSSFSVGWATNADLPLGPYTEFRGQAVDPTTILIRGTRIGDATLDGRVNDDDITIVGAFYGTASGANWATGDFNYDGKVNDDDVTLVSALYDPSAPPLPAPAAVAAGSVAAVPEPASWLMLTLGGLGAGLFGWRRRSKKA